MSTTDQKPENPVNLYFGNLKESGILNNPENKDNKSTNYIILQNDALHKKVEELQTRVNELERENEELESDNGSLETSKTSLKGYISNMAAYNRS